MAQASNQTHAQRQRLLLAIFGVIAAIVVSIMIIVQIRTLFPSQTANVPVQQQIELSRIDQREPEEAWIELAEGRVQNIESDVSQVLQANDELRSQNEELKQEIATILEESRQAIQIQQELLDQQLHQRRKALFHLNQHYHGQ